LAILEEEVQVLLQLPKLAVLEEEVQILLRLPKLAVLIPGLAKEQRPEECQLR